MIVERSYDLLTFYRLYIAKAPMINIGAFAILLRSIVIRRSLKVGRWPFSYNDFSLSTINYHLSAVNYSFSIAAW